MLRSEAAQAGPDDAGAGSVELLLDKVGLWSDAAVNADLWVPDELTLCGRVVAHDIALAIVLDRILARGLFPAGFSRGNGGRLYHYKRE